MAGKENNKGLILGCLWDRRADVTLDGFGGWSLSEKEVDKHCIRTSPQ